METITYQAELTDLFCGEVNCSWVNRCTFTLPANATDRQIVRAAKLGLGLTGCRCRRSDLGDLIELRPVGSLTIAFITPNY
jgi:hypothetical protein